MYRSQMKLKRGVKSELANACAICDKDWIRLCTVPDLRQLRGGAIYASACTLRQRLSFLHRVPSLTASDTGSATQHPLHALLDGVASMHVQLKLSAFTFLRVRLSGQLYVPSSKAKGGTHRPYRLYRHRLATHPRSQCRSGYPSD